MRLIQLLLPLYDNDGVQQPDELFAEVRRTLTEKYGGLTTYSRAPARGLWQEDDGKTSRDEIVIYEVMTDAVDRDWWRGYPEQLERSFRQKEIVVRSQEIELL